MAVNIKAAMVSHLYNNDVVRELVDDRIHQDAAPSDAGSRYITVQFLGATPMRHLVATSGKTDARLQINAWADNRPDADAVAEAIRLALDHYLGTLGTPPHEATVGMLHLECDPDAFIPPKRGKHVGTFGARQTATIEHTESVPVFT